MMMPLSIFIITIIAQTTCALLVVVVLLRWTHNIISTSRAPGAGASCVRFQNGVCRPLYYSRIFSRIGFKLSEKRSHAKVIEFGLCVHALYGICYHKLLAEKMRSAATRDAHIFHLDDVSCWVGWGGGSSRRRRRRRRQGIVLLSLVVCLVKSGSARFNITRAHELGHKYTRAFAFGVAH